VSSKYTYRWPNNVNEYMIVILFCEERYKDMNCHHSFVNNFKQLWTIQALIVHDFSTCPVITEFDHIIIFYSQKTKFQNKVWN